MERKRSLHHAVALGLLVLALGRPAPAQYSGGAGTPDDPYHIASTQDLIDLGNTPSDYDKHFALTADIHLPGTTFDRALIAPTTHSGSHGAGGAPFTGVFAGNHHSIRHLRIEGEGYLGLFGYLGSSAVVSDLGLADASIRGTAYGAGGLAGRNEGTVLYCYSTAAVTGNGEVGSLVGYNAGRVSNCYSSGEVTGAEAAGNSRRGSFGHVGGLVGRNSGSILNCYSSGAVTGNSSVGGLVAENSGRVSNCYSTGAVTGDGNVGGLVADNGRGSVVSSFWDMETSGLTASDGGVGLTRSQMRDMGTYLDAGWDFAGESVNGTVETWQMLPVGGYPRLAVFEGYEPVLPAGQGTLAEPFLITNAEELGSIGYRPLACYRLEADIDLSGITWSIAPVPWFAGHLDGNGHMIGHLQIQGGGLLGLFGSLAANSVVMDLGLEGGWVQGAYGLIGSLAGRSEATLINCYSTGAVSGEDDIGGLVGENSGSVLNCHSAGTVAGNSHSVGGLVGSNSHGSISNCYSTSAVTGHGYHVGGLVGYNSDGGSISTCYSSGTITGYDDVGGLVGRNGASVSNCYSSSEVNGGNGDIGGLVGYNWASVVGSFWDIESSGVAYSSGGAGLTTAEMMDPGWIGLQGWANDPNWLLDPHQDYPRLAWEGTEGQMVPEPTIDWMVGQGTRETPYEISDPSQLLMISKASLLWEKSLALVSDLDLAGIVWPQAVIPALAGHFEGNDHAIKNLRVTGSSYLGLLGRLEEGGAILNLGLLDVRIEGSGGRVGGLVGDSDGYVSNCHSTGPVTGHNHVGGLAGVNDGSISNCHTTGVITGGSDLGGLAGFNSGRVSDCYSTSAVRGNGSRVGGLVGFNPRGRLSNCYSTGAVTAIDEVGGLVGFNHSSGSISNCYSSGPVTGNDDIGGLVGHNRASVLNCHSSGAVTGNDGVGGLVGYDYVNASISNCYSTSAVMGNGNVGGLVGYVRPGGSVVNCYSTGTVTGNRDVGGLVGYVRAGGSVEHSFWDIQTSGLTASAGGTGLITTEMQDIDTYLDAGWDFVEETENGVADIWWIDEGRDYPRLWWELDKE